MELSYIARTENGGVDYIDLCCLVHSLLVGKWRSFKGNRLLWEGEIKVLMKGAGQGGAEPR